MVPRLPGCKLPDSHLSEVKNMTSGEVVSRAEFTSLQSLFMHTLSMKHIPLPKMMVRRAAESFSKCRIFSFKVLQALLRHPPPGPKTRSYGPAMCFVCTWISFWGCCRTLTLASGQDFVKFTTSSGDDCSNAQY